MGSVDWINLKKSIVQDGGDFQGSQRFRKQMGLRPMEPKKLQCLRCGHEFMSVDRRNNRICSQCNNVIKNQPDFYYV